MGKGEGGERERGEGWERDQVRPGVKEKGYLILCRISGERLNTRAVRWMTIQARSPRLPQLSVAIERWQGERMGVEDGRNI